MFYIIGIIIVLVILTKIFGGIASVFKVIGGLLVLAGVVALCIFIGNKIHLGTGIRKVANTTFDGITSSISNAKIESKKHKVEQKEENISDKLVPFDTEYTILISDSQNASQDQKLFEANITSFLSNYKGLKIVDRSRINEIKKEMNFQLSDWSNDEKSAEIGKALNADIILFFKPTNGKDIKENVEFLDINTMQKVSYILSINDDSISNLDLTKFSSSLNPFSEYVTWDFRKFLQSSVNFTKDIPPCPYSKIQCVELKPKQISKLPHSLQNIDNITFDADTVTIVYKDGTNLEGRFSYENETPHVIGTKQGNPYYDGKCGTLTLKLNGFYEDLSVYQNKPNEFTLLLITSKKDGTGKATFMKFSK